MFTIATPLVWAGVGEVIVERTGILNLGIEGTMYLGAFVGFLTALRTGSPWLGLVAAIVSGVLAGALMGLFSVTLGLNQHVSGLGLTLLLIAGCDFTFRLMYTGERPSLDNKFHAFFPGSEVFNQHWLTYVGFLVLAPVAWWVLRSTGMGYRLHAVGENFEAADVAGISVTRTRYVALMVGGALMAIGGAFLTLAVLGQLHPRHRQRARLGVHRAGDLRPMAGLAGCGRRAHLRRHRRVTAAAGDHVRVQCGARRADARVALPRSHRRTRHRGAQRALPRVVPQGLPTWLRPTSKRRPHDRRRDARTRSGRGPPRDCPRAASRSAPRWCTTATCSASGHNRRVQLGSAIRHGETDCLENVGRLPATRVRRVDDGHDAVAVRHVHRRDPAVRHPARGRRREPARSSAARTCCVRAGSRSWCSTIAECVEMMTSFIEANPGLWNEDIGEQD